MTVKILLDPVLTATDPSRCSTYYQFHTFVESTLAARDDVFFYWLLPDWVAPEHRAWLPQDPRVRYFDIAQHKDRTKEYVTLRDAMDLKIAFNGELWDFDVMLTVRAGLIPLLKMVMTSPKQVSHAWTKEVWLIEEMPMLKFKKTVAVLHPDVHELYTLAGYLAAERVYVMSYHEKPKIIETARNYLAPSQVRALHDKIKAVVPVQLKDFRLKDPSFFYRPGGKQKFCIAYVGRLATSDANLDKVYAAMTNAWVLRGDTVRLLVLTVSTGGAAQPPEHVEIQRAPREEFWRIAREDMHLLVIMHSESQFSLSLTEPLMFGVPAVVVRATWSVAMLGPDYPFFVQGEGEAYAMMKCFYEDYAGMYERFVHWHESFFKPVFTERFASDLIYGVLGQEVERFDRGMLQQFRERMPGRARNDIVDAVLGAVAGLDEFVLFDVLDALSKGRVLRSLGVKLKLEDRDYRGLVWATAWNDYRVMLKAFHGWEDASTTVGHLRRVAA